MLHATNDTTKHTLFAHAVCAMYHLNNSNAGNDPQNNRTVNNVYNSRNMHDKVAAANDFFHTHIPHRRTDLAIASVICSTSYLADERNMITDVPRVSNTFKMFALGDCYCFTNCKKHHLLFQRLPLTRCFPPVKPVRTKTQVSQPSIGDNNNLTLEEIPTFDI